MFSVDTSTLVAFFAGESASDTALLERVLAEGLLQLTPAVVSEILSDPKLPKQHERVVLSLPQVTAETGFWERVGRLRRAMISKRRKASLADSMIAQFCVDHRLTLITRDLDYKGFQGSCSLKLAF